MAYKKISELTNLSNPSLTGVTAVVDGNTTYKTSLNSLRQVLVNSGSHTFTGSQTIIGNLIISGSITAQQYTISSSLVNYEIQNISGSTNFGNTLDDNHNFTGSVNISGSLIINGFELTSMSSGTSGIDGSSGTSGLDGSSGTSGESGSSGTSGLDGSSGTSGESGSSGTSGLDGSSGTSGESGSSGTSGIDGSSGTSGESGSSGTSGTSPIVDTSMFAITGSNNFIGDQNIYNGNIYNYNEFNDAEFYVNLENIEPYISLVNYAEDGHASFYIEGHTGSLQITADHEGAAIRSYINSATDYIDVIRFSDYDDDGSIDIYTDTRISGSLLLHNLYLNTGLTEYVVIDNNTGKLYYTNIGGTGSSGTSGIDGSSGTSGIDGSSGTSGESGSSGTSGTSPIVDTSMFAITGSNNFYGDQNIYTGSLYMSSDNGSQFYVNLSNIEPYVTLTNYEDNGNVTLIVESISGSVVLFADNTGSYLSDFVYSLGGYTPIIKFSNYDGDGSIDITRNTRISGSLSVEDLLLNTGLTQYVVVDNTGKLYYTNVGASGSSGTSGTSGDSGSSGTSGTSGDSGSSGTSGTSGDSGSSGTSGTSGTSPIIDVNSLATTGSNIFTGIQSFEGIQEYFTIDGNFSGNRSFDFNSGSIFYLTQLGGNGTWNIVNLPNTSNKATTITFVIEQGVTAYSASSYQFDNNNITIKWADNIIPTGSSNKTDIIGLTAFRSGSSWNVLGSLSTFG